MDRVAAWVPSPTTTPADRRQGLETRCSIDGVAGDRVLMLTGGDREQDRPGVDPDPRVEIESRRRSAPLDAEGRPHGSLGFILVRDRRSEQGRDSVAQGPVDVAAVTGDFGGQDVVVGQEKGAHVLGVEALRYAR